MRAKYGAPLAWLNSVLMAPETNKCIEWPFGRTAKGYGQVRIGKVRMNANRYICLKAHGLPPSTLHTDSAHSCGNSLCCNPKHLRHATSLENSEDAIRHGTVLRGAMHPRSKLTEEQALEVKRLLASGSSLSDIGRKFGVTHKAISFIRDGVNWGWLEAV